MVTLSPVLSGISVGSLDSSRYPLSPASRCAYHLFHLQGDIHGIAFIGITRQLNRNRTSSSAFNTGADGATVSTAKSPAGPGHWCYLPGLWFPRLQKLTICRHFIRRNGHISFTCSPSSAVSVCSTVSVVPSGLVTSASGYHRQRCLSVPWLRSVHILQLFGIHTICRFRNGNYRFASVAPSPSVSPGIWVSAAKQPHSRVSPGYCPESEWHWRCLPVNHRILRNIHGYFTGSHSSLVTVCVTFSVVLSGRVTVV